MGIQRPESYPFSLNSTVDILLREEFDAYRAKKIQHPLFKENGIKDRLFKNQKLLNQWRNNLAGIRYFDDNLKATLYGAMDDILESENGKLSPMDYKTTGAKVSKVYDKFQLQMDVYSFLLEKNGYETTGRGYMAFYIVDKDKGFLDRLPFRKEIYEIETNSSDIYDIFKDAVEVLNKKDPPAHSRECRFKNWLAGAKQFI